MYYQVPSTWRRLFARWADSALSLVFFFPLGLDFVMELVNSGRIQVDVRVLILCALSAFFYEVLFVWFFGATVGKWIFGLRVVNSRNFHLKPNFIQSFLRHFANQLSLFWSMSGVVLAFIRYDRRHLSDWIAETRVVQLGPRSSPPKIRWIVTPILFFYFLITGISNTAHNLKAIKLEGNKLSWNFRDANFGEDSF